MKYLWALLLLAGTISGQIEPYCHHVHGEEFNCPLDYWEVWNFPIMTREPPRLPLVESLALDPWYACKSDELLGWNGKGEHVCIPPPEPMDVPAIRSKKKELLSTEPCWFAITEGAEGMSDYPQCKFGYKWTCADPKRILLQSVDGKWHCLKF